MNIKILSLTVVLSIFLLLPACDAGTPQPAADGPTVQVLHSPEKELEAIYLDYIARQQNILAQKTNEGDHDQVLNAQAKIAATKKCLSDLRRIFGLQSPLLQHSTTPIPTPAPTPTTQGASSTREPST